MRTARGEQPRGWRRRGKEGSGDDLVAQRVPARPEAAREQLVKLYVKAQDSFDVKPVVADTLVRRLTLPTLGRWLDSALGKANSPNAKHRLLKSNLERFTSSARASPRWRRSSSRVRSKR